jgi:hypothetical protein
VARHKGLVSQRPKKKITQFKKELKAEAIVLGPVE